MGRGTGALLTLSLISLLGLVWMRQALAEYSIAQTIIMIVLALSAVVLIAASSKNAGWTWPFSVLFFAVVIANTTLVYWTAGEAFLEYGLLLGWSVLGILYGTLKASTDFEEAVEIYDSQKPVKIENVMPEPKIVKKIKVSTTEKPARKAAKKTSAKKSASRKKTANKSAKKKPSKRRKR